MLNRGTRAERHHHRRENALGKAGVDLGENGSIIPRPKGKR
jgi:hypothetical protein